MSEGVVVALCAVLMFVGIIGIVVPILPGLLLVILAVLIWAISTGGATAWAVFGATAVVYAIGVVAQFLIPGRRLKSQGVGMGTMVAAIVCAIVGFFVIPVVGAFIGFVLGIFAVETARSRGQGQGQAWARTKAALRAIVHSMGIELATAFVIAVIFTIGVLST